MYSSPSIIRMIKSRRMRCAGHVVRMGEKWNAYRILVGRPKGKRPSGRHRRKWENNININFREIGWGLTDWIHLAQVREEWRELVNTVLKFRVL
jgi:hypothetical protein